MSEAQGTGFYEKLMARDATLKEDGSPKNLNRQDAIVQAYLDRAKDEPFSILTEGQMRAWKAMLGEPFH